ncbi:hypothetical protein M0812_11316 [Anaeramoeba flamelloides]|uniref:Uncharacterized protein n=1 Tax=Anaeramoeba flamelloides TaxID=1746091 RepID=A0AAV7ZY62_9EUKA|nr:hypothetical protein M0812_11316 [Anaeramoeba flamelloides]
MNFFKSYSTPNISISKEETQIPTRPRSNITRSKYDYGDLVVPEPKKDFLKESNKLDQMMKSCNFLKEINEIFPDNKPTFFQKSQSLGNVSFEKFTYLNCFASTPTTRKRTKKQKKKKTKTKKKKIQNKNQNKNKNKNRNKNKQEFIIPKENEYKIFKKVNTIYDHDVNKNTFINFVTDTQTNTNGNTEACTDKDTEQDEELDTEQDTDLDTEPESDRNYESDLYTYGESEKEILNNSNKVKEHETDLEIDELLQQNKHNFNNYQNNQFYGTNNKNPNLKIDSLAFSPPTRSNCPLGMDRDFLTLAHKLKKLKIFQTTF